MKVAVLGLWHLGAVTAACLASLGHEVVGIALEPEACSLLQDGKPPLFEPGLEELMRAEIAAGRLRFSNDAQVALAGVDVVWVTFDTPVDDDDRADVDFVVQRVVDLFPSLPAGCLVLISSQLPAGTTRRIEALYAERFVDKSVSFAYSPENLRLGKAIDAFLKPGRIVVGTRSERDRERLAVLLKPITGNVEWMSVESAEMTKHALNAFLAMSVAFSNELAGLCEEIGADAKEVERGLKSEERIGERAYLAPGEAFAGGTLARDVAFLTQMGKAMGRATHLLGAVRLSNQQHKQWARLQLGKQLGQLAGKKVTLWGLTYKPGTDTLRRSQAIELGIWLSDQGAEVHAHDPAVKELPAELSKKIVLYDHALSSVTAADALVVCTPWPDYRALAGDAVVAAMNQPAVIIDANRFLKPCFESVDSQLKYIAVGRATG